MSNAAAVRQTQAEDPYRIGHEGGESRAPGHGIGGPAAERIVIGYGFWIFILSDIVLFAALFAAYAVLKDATADGPGSRQIVDLSRVAWETGCLLLSSFMCGMASLAEARRSQFWTQAALLLTGLLGLAFVLMEAAEFRGLVEQGFGPSHSAFLSAFFTLVGCHGLHVSVGLLWLGTMMAQFFFKGFHENIRYRFLCFSLFWHALDIIWVAIFTIVYLIGAIT